ncbi:hypothetical protein ACQ4PT_042272 [Festuca glaucescens]
MRRSRRSRAVARTTKLEEKTTIAASTLPLPQENMSAPQQQRSTSDNQHPCISIDELLEVIRGANVMPVLLITSSDGRLSAIAVTGLQNVVLSNHEVHGSTEKKLQDFRAWLRLIMSLAATVTFTAGLTPPGGFWAADDKEKGYVAGTSVMRDKFPTRYNIFETSNTSAFCLSLMIIGTLATKFDNKKAAAFRALLFPRSCRFLFYVVGD